MASEDIVKYQFTSEQSRSEAAENGRKGGVASGAARRRKKSLKEAADYFLSLPVTDARVRNNIAKTGVETEEIDYQLAMIVGLTRRAITGDSKAAKVIIDLLGEDGKEIGGGVQIIDDL